MTRVSIEPTPGTTKVRLVISGDEYELMTETINELRDALNRWHDERETRRWKPVRTTGNVEGFSNWQVRRPNHQTAAVFYVKDFGEEMARNEAEECAFRLNLKEGLS